jgi:hypothetical protein
MSQLVIKYATTSDMDDGRPLPPLGVDGDIWCVVRRLHGARTLWRFIRLETPKHAADRRPVALALISRRQTRHPNL